MAMAEAARARSVMHEMRKSRCRNFAHTLPRRASQHTGPQLSSLSKSRACYPEHQHTPSRNCEGAVAESSRPMRPMVHHLRSLSGAKRSRKILPPKWRRTQRSRRPARASRCRSAIVPSPLHPRVGISADVEDGGSGPCPRVRARCRTLMGPRQRQRWPLAGAALPRRGGQIQRAGRARRGGLSRLQRGEARQRMACPVLFCIPLAREFACFTPCLQHLQLGGVRPHTAHDGCDVTTHLQS
jgi:hypothetical protein